MSKEKEQKILIEDDKTDMYEINKAEFFDIMEDFMDWSGYEKEFFKEEGYQRLGREEFEELRDVIEKHWKTITSMMVSPHRNYVSATTMDKLLLVNKPMIFDEDEVLQKKLEYWKYIKKNADLCIKTIEEDMPKSRVIQVARFLNDKNKGGTNKC